jgi:signal transduction histidine kinase
LDSNEELREMSFEEDIRQDIEAVSRIDAVPMILDVVCRTTHMRFAAVARVTEQRWVCCSSLDHLGFGLAPGGELQIETTICNEIRGHGEPVVIDHVAQSDVYCGHPTPAMYGFQSYVSFPIRRRNGEFFGTLCAIDPKPARVSTPEVKGMFKLFGDLISFHLDAQDRLEATEAALLDARESAILREQFIAVLGHDLRNPLNALSSGTQLLATMPSAEAPRVLARMSRSIARMTELIANVTDFARGRLGSGLHIARTSDRSLLGAELHQVLAELRAAWPDRIIDAHMALDRDVSVDVPRIGQLLSNLLANALLHGAPDHPVRLDVTTSDEFELLVTNHGTPIAPVTQARLFQPFTRGTDTSNPQGLGLGLYIVAEIAKAHGGTVSVESSDAVTRFRFRLPF